MRLKSAKTAQLYLSRGYAKNPTLVSTGLRVAVRNALNRSEAAENGPPPVLMQLVLRVAPARDRPNKPLHCFGAAQNRPIFSRLGRKTAACVRPQDEHTKWPNRCRADISVMTPRHQWHVQR